MLNANQHRVQRLGQRRGVFSRLDANILELDPIAMQKRVALNKSPIFMALPHPRIKDIVKWTLQHDHTLPDPYSPTEVKHISFIRGATDIDIMVDILSESKTIAIDMEFDNQYSYYGLTCYIKISTKNHDFVVDAIPLFNIIPERLSNIFLNENVLKIVFGTQDLLAFQRDFNLRLFPVVDFQNVYKMFNSLSQEPGLKEVVKDFLGTDITRLIIYIIDR